MLGMQSRAKMCVHLPLNVAGDESFENVARTTIHVCAHNENQHWQGHVVYVMITTRCCQLRKCTCAFVRSPSRSCVSSWCAHMRPVRAHKCTSITRCLAYSMNKSSHVQCVWVSKVWHAFDECGYLVETGMCVDADRLLCAHICQLFCNTAFCYWLPICLYILSPPNMLIGRQCGRVDSVTYG
jgi:hypothetical protein